MLNRRTVASLVLGAILAGGCANQSTKPVAAQPATVPAVAQTPAPVAPATPPAPPAPAVVATPPAPVTPAAAVPGRGMPRNPALPTIWVVGDSTANNNASGGLGWGAPFIKLFDESKVNVVNRARGGRSSRSFIVEGLWNWVLEDSKPGDYVILQMGHNDGGGTNVSNPNGRPSIGGLGEETQEITMAAGRGGNPPERKEVVHTYGWYMRKYVADARAKGLKIIIASSVPHLPREAVKDGDVETRFAQVLWAEQVAAAEKVPFIHVNKIIYSKYAGMDPANIRTKYFTPPNDGTHTSPAGAELNARCVAEGLKTLPDMPFNGWLLP